MKVINQNGNLQLVDDTASIPSGASVLNSPATITKATSSNKGKQARIENVRSNNVVVEVEGTGYRTYDFSDLSN